MSRWGRGRGGSVAVPLDSALFRENSNCPTAARSAGTVGKWGITSFTSIRSAPYAYSNNILKKPVQDQNSPLTVPTVETEQPPPKPKKFFKSRNAELYPPVPQITYAPPVPAAPLSPEHTSNSKEKKNKKARSYTRDSSSPEIPWRGSDKTKSKKSTVATKASKKEDVQAPNTQPPNKRYLVRNRNKVINYAEDGSNSPIPDFTSHYDTLPGSTGTSSPKITSPKRSSLAASPPPVKSEVVSPSTSKEANEERKPPPIVLRISKGTSRIVSTDSNEGFTSPNSDRHSSLDTHSDVGSDHKKSPSMETICSPKHEGLKITIKCPGLNHEVKKEKKKEKKDHKSHKRHHKNSEDDVSKKPTSPLPGSQAYELYKTLASPVEENEKESKSKSGIEDEIESQLAKLDSTGPAAKSPRLEVEPNETPPEPKPPESSSGRSRRNRPNINYSENDDYLDVLTTGTCSKYVAKTVGDLKREAKIKKKKQEVAAEASSAPTAQETNNADENNCNPAENSDLVEILAGVNENKNTNDVPKKPHKKQRHKQNKNVSPDHEQDIIPEIVPEQIDSQGQESQDMVIDTAQVLNANDTPNYSQTGTHSSDSAYNSCPNENFEDELQKNSQDNLFKSPHHVGETDEHVDDKPSVKLVITKKKGSIFKSKSLVNDNPSPLPARKRRHLYRHEWANDKGNETPRPEPQENSEVRIPTIQAPEELTRVTRYRAPDPIMDDIESADAVKPYTSVKCAKEAKEFYTVVRNVKKAHQIQEIGEFQEFNDDVEYLLDALQDNNPMSTRCLSAITLASKCTAPAFRMHLRAHGTVQKFFSALHDATNDQSLGLCTATVMFVLSQDRLNMDLDRESLELMLNLLESDVSHKNALDDCGLTSAQLTKTQERVRELCAEIKSQGKAQHLDLDNITVGHLAMETLLSLTSKRAGEWFKEELRVLGGVEHIVRTIRECNAALADADDLAAGADDDDNVDTAQLRLLRTADRCMRVLENVTQQNEDNQMYLIKECGGAAQTLAALLRRCCAAARAHGACGAAGAAGAAGGACATGAGAARRARVRAALLDAALPAIKVLVNLSHSFGSTTSVGAQVVGEEQSVMETCLIILNNHDNFIPDDRNFEFSVCVLLLLINLVQNNEVNTQRLLNIRIRVDNEEDVSRSVSAIDLLVDLFYKREDLARRAEENTDALLDGEKESENETDKKKQSQDDIDETVAKLLARAGAHMEHTMVGAYTALVLGHAACAAGAGGAAGAGAGAGAAGARGSPGAVRARLPAYEPLLPTLRKYYNFLALTASAEAAIAAHVKSTQRIIEFMENCDKESAAQYSAPAPYPAPYYQTSPSDVPQDMSLSNLNYSINSYNSSSSERLSSSMEVDSYH